MRSKEFEKWWEDEGCEIEQKRTHDLKTHVKRVAEIAWANGQYMREQHVEHLMGRVIGAIQRGKIIPAGLGPR